MNYMVTAKKRLCVPLMSLTVASVLFSGWCLLTRDSSEAYRKAMCSEALRTVGTVALAYLKDHGSPPTAVSELFDSGYFHLESDGAIWIYRPAGCPSGSVLDQPILKVRITIPVDSGEYVLGPAGVVSKESGKPLQIVSLPSTEPAIPAR